MVKRFLEGGKSLIYSKQTNILSAAAIIMFMIGLSRVLGLVRNRALAEFFYTSQLDNFWAAFQVSDTLFEILILGGMSSAFVPVFSSYLSKGKDKEGWRVAALILNLLFLGSVVLGSLIYILAEPIYSLTNYSAEQVQVIASYTRILIFAQLFFVASFLMTAILESHQRFLVSAAAPLFYNFGIIGSTYLFAPSIGLMAPILGALVGSILHFGVQLPVALKLGFRPVVSFDFADPGVRKIVKLAIPRVVELTFFQIKKYTDLFLASFIIGGLTYFKFGDALAALPVGLFGLSIAKASLPKLSYEANEENLDNFKKTFTEAFKQILFLVLPVGVFISVLRLPLVRLAYGADKFLWEDTNQTGYAVSAFAIGMFAYALSLLVSRAFYALHDTLTPVKVSIAAIFINVILGFVLIFGVQKQIWVLSLAYSIAGFMQLSILLYLLSRKTGGLRGFGVEQTFTKLIIASGVSGGLMFFLLKILDRSAWDKKLSFLQHIGLALPETFDKFLLDTKYTTNLIVLTLVVAVIGTLVFLALAYLLKIQELRVLVKLAEKMPLAGGVVRKFVPVRETVSPTPQNGINP